MGHRAQGGPGTIQGRSGLPVAVEGDREVVDRQFPSWTKDRRGHPDSSHRVGAFRDVGPAGPRSRTLAHLGQL